MSILFTQYWDVRPNQQEEYSRFIGEEYIPTTDSLGIHLVGGYYVAVGEGPRIIAVAEAEKEEDLQKRLSTREYLRISSTLFRFVWNYSSKVWAASGRVQEGPYRIQAGVWKFNQYYNVLQGMEGEHRRFVKEVCIPGMKKLGVPITGGWRLVMGSGPRVLAECTARNIVDIAKAIDTSEFRSMVRTLKRELATDYSSRILAPTGRIEMAYMMKEMLNSF